MENKFQLEGKVVLSVGPIMLDAAKFILKQNLKAFIFLDVADDDSSLNELKGLSKNTEILYRKCDVSDAQDMAEAYDYAWNSFGYIHLVIHAAAIVDEDDSRKLINFNVAGMIDGSMWLWNKMRKNAGGEGGTIINISTTMSILGLPMLPIYSATKHAIRCFGECLGNSYHYEKTGVRVLTLCAGFTDTPLDWTLPKRMADGIQEDLEKFINGVKFQKVENVAKAIVDIYENAASGTIWVSHLDLPVIQHIAKGEEELYETYFSK